ncbi:Protein of unknown function (DUF3093) [Haloactinopolyspora alba]|uniref:DUF3093 family protein n=1 Tax=Haloactinopolyspora alba TaxID=648780 RepID=A0A2P8E2L6_9ACTN|nr:DUF3093 domain-containing protein [Haloactinopolyspora alba]PSL03721.1 Protein of unknown function (DUF3093) [Haloactinopolyspora alba]
MTNYRERLWVPVLWWGLLVALAGAVWMVYHHAYGPAVSLPVGLGVLALGAALLFAYGRALIAVDDTTLTVGRARIPLANVGTVEALDGERARAARGPELDPRAYTVIRGYAPAVVRVGVDDPDDPTPYWLVTTRRPDRLAAVLEAARQHTA